MTIVDELRELMGQDVYTRLRCNNEWTIWGDLDTTGADLSDGIVILYTNEFCTITGSYRVRNVILVDQVQVVQSTERIDG